MKARREAGEPEIGPSLQVEVMLDPAFTEGYSPDATLFVYARRIDGPPMPLAIWRGVAGEFPVQVVLDDTLAMMPEMNLSKAREVMVVARISESGQAERQSGDLIGEVGAGGRRPQRGDPSDDRSAHPVNLPVPLYIGLRYLRARHRHRFISFISLVSTLGIALGLTAVIAVMSVMNGFHTEIRDRLLGMVSHISISEPDRKLQDWRGLAEQLTQYPEVVASAPFIEGQGMLLYRDRVSGVGLRGMLPTLEAEASRIAQHMTRGTLGRLEPGAYRIVLGDELARHLNVRVGDQVTLIVPRAASTVAGLLPKFRRFEVVGIFDLDMRAEL